MSTAKNWFRFICCYSWNVGILLQTLPWQAVRLTRFAATKASVSTISELPSRGRKLVGAWLLGCAGMCFGAVTLGGITR